MDNAPVSTTVGEAASLGAKLLGATGVPGERAHRSAWLLAVTELWGLRSHGLLRLPYYLERLVEGGSNPAADLRTVRDGGATVALDGEAGLGHWQAWEAAGIAAERARTHGIAAVSVADSGHCGSLGLYAMRLAGAGLVGLVASNGPAAIAPWGGNRPLVSTSPIAAAFPAGERPVVVDLALSAVTRGKIAEHAASGKPLEEGWALDAGGRPTTDPDAALAGMVAPAGGAKGFALALLLEALTGGMVGPKLSTEVADPLAHAAAGRKQGLSHLVVAIDVETLDATGGALARLAELRDGVEAAGGRVPGRNRVHPDDVNPSEALQIAGPTASAIAVWAERMEVALPAGWTSPSA